MYQRGPNRVSSMARAGGAGAMAVCLMGFGVVLLFPGTIMMGVAFGDSTWEDDFFDSMRIIAMVLFILGGTMVTVASVLCCYVCKNANQATMGSSQGGAIISTSQTQPGMVVSGYTPAPVVAGGYPMGQVAPPGGYQQSYQQPAAYPSQPTGQYPPQQQYPPQHGGYPQGGYNPVPQQAPYNPPTNPAYPPSAPSAPSAPDMAPPPSYNEVTGGDRKY